MKSKRNIAMSLHKLHEQSFGLKESKKSMSILKKKLRNSKSSVEFKGKEKHKMFLAKELSKIMEINAGSFMGGSKYPSNYKIKSRKYTQYFGGHQKDCGIGSVLSRHTSVHNNTGNIKIENKSYEMINELEANDNISMNVYELNTPQQKKFRELNTEVEEDEDFSADIEDVEEENVGDVRRKVRCFWDRSKDSKSAVEGSDKKLKSKIKIKEQIYAENTHSIYEEKFIEEFWKVIHQQNDKINYLLNKNDELKLQLKDTNKAVKSIKESNDFEFLTIKSKLKNIDEQMTKIRSKSPMESINSFVRHRNCEILNPVSDNSLNKVHDFKNSENEYMIVKPGFQERTPDGYSDYGENEPQHDCPNTTEGKLAKLYRSKKNSIDCFETFAKQQLTDVENQKMAQREYSTESSPVKKMIKSTLNSNYRFKKKWCK